MNTRIMPAQEIGALPSAAELRIAADAAALRALKARACPIHLGPDVEFTREELQHLSAREIVRILEDCK